MRTYNDIYESYLEWTYERTGKDSYLPENFFDKRFPEEEIRTRKAFLYKNILEKCYHPIDGMFYFTKFVIGGLEEIGYPTPFRFNTLLRKWDKLVKSKKRLSVLCARGHGKSLFFSQIGNIYETFLFSNRRILIESASQEQADILLEEIKRIIENNEWLATKINKDKWRAGMLGYNGGFILGKGFGSEIRGLHLDKIVIDDILRSDNKLSDQEIEDFIDMVLSPMLLNRKGQMILVGTPKSETDIFMTIKRRIKEGSVWTLKEYPAILDFDNKILQCPDRFSWEDIINKRLEMGALKFSREYQLEFFSRDQSLFPEEIINPAKERGESLSLMRVGENLGPNWSYVGGVDVARSGSASADYTVVFILAYNQISQEKRIAHMWREKGMKIRDQAARIAELSVKFNHPLFVVEQNNVGIDMIDELVDEFNVNVQAFITGGRGQKKDDLIRFLITAFEYDQMIIPRGDRFSREAMDILEYELAKFCTTLTHAGNEQFKGMGAHDDTVMALALANRGTQELGIPFAVTNFGGGGSNSHMKEYDALMDVGSNRKESDLVQKIRMGIIK